MMTDIVLLTDPRYVHPVNPDWYVQNILTEDALLRQALEQRGLKVERVSWDDPHFNWSATRYALFRTTWDYFHRIQEFSSWLERVRHLTRLINPPELVWWNLDKKYLLQLSDLGIPIPPTVYVQRHCPYSLSETITFTGWEECILKPAISGAARHTYRFRSDEASRYEEVFRQLNGQEDLLLQEFQHQVLSKGEVAFMLFDGKFSHAILKRARPGDFRVQDDFGGTVHDYQPSYEEIAFAEKVVAACPVSPVYARVDMLWDNQDRLCVSELELIEPELWLRKNEQAAERFAKALLRIMK
jgi:glutathione synthase/RimK-type ligase-like ATP-grasp enzyme